VADQLDKGRLLKSLQAQHLFLEVALEQLAPPAMLIPVSPSLWTVKDIIAHVNVWDRRGTGWLADAAAGKTPAIPLPGKTWNDLDALNAATYEEHKDRSLTEVLAEFEALFPPLVRLVESISEERLAQTITYHTGEREETIPVARLVRWRYRHYLTHGEQIRTWLKNALS